MPKINEKEKIPNHRGLIISYFGNSVAVETADGQVFHCQLRRNQELPVVGDFVLFEKSGTSITITGIETRKTLLNRGDRGGHPKPIAANIDVILIVMVPPPQFSEYLIDRYLVAAELLKLDAALVLNKIDLLDEESAPNAQSRLEPYRALSYPVILSSIYTPHGLQGIGRYMKGKTGVLVGPSGVGKSSIISQLCGQEVRVSTVSHKGSGKHTTTATKLYHLPQGGSLIDSPGVREFNLWGIDKIEILEGFKEFKTYFGSCKFRDCSHLVEPNCGIQKAVLEGKISIKRYESYQKLINNDKS